MNTKPSENVSNAPAEKTDTEETNYGYIEEATMDDVPTVTKLPVTTYEPVIDVTPQD